MVGGEELGNEVIGAFEGGFVLGGLLVFRGIGTGDPGKIDEGKVRLREVAGDDGAVMSLSPLFGEGGGELTGDGMFAARGGVDLEQGRHGTPWISRLRLVLR